LFTQFNHRPAHRFAGEKFRRLKPESQPKLIVFLDTLRAPAVR
jgi:hypothetical protein